jgi:hypothetical protein
VLPAQQRLGGAQLPGLDVDDRLEREPQLVLGSASPSPSGSAIQSGPSDAIAASTTASRGTPRP